MVKQCPPSQTQGWGPADVLPALSTDTQAEDRRERESGAGQAAQSPSPAPEGKSPCHLRYPRSVCGSCSPALRTALSA